MSFSCQPAETTGKGLCKTCLEMYDFSFCGKCTLKRDIDDIKFASKKYLPSLFLFPLGFIVLFVLFRITKPEPFYVRIVAGIIGGWGLGGAIWGWYLIGTMLGPNEHSARTTRIPEINDLSIIIWSLVRILLSVFAGFVAMPMGLIKLKMAYSNAKKITITANGNDIKNGRVA